MAERHPYYCKKHVDSRGDPARKRRPGEGPTNPCYSCGLIDCFGNVKYQGDRTEEQREAVQRHEDQFRRECQAPHE